MNKMKKYYLLAAAAMVFAGCSKDGGIADIPDGTDPDNGKGRVISVVSDLPAQDEETRIDLLRDGANIKLTWQVGDQIQLCFVQNEIRLKATTTVKGISANEKQAYFDIVVPADIQTGEFDLYGVYGGRGLSDSDPTLARLPTEPWLSRAGFADMKARNQIMLIFEKKAIDVESAAVNVAFKHTGALFCVKIKSTYAGTDKGLRQLGLTFVGVNDAPNTPFWGGGTGNDATYNFLTGTFAETGYRPTFYMYRTFELVSNGNVYEYWASYAPNKNFVPVSYLIRMDLNHGATDGSTTTIRSDNNTTSVPGKGRAMHATEAGKIYYFYAEYSGTEVKFVDSF